MAKQLDLNSLSNQVTGVVKVMGKTEVEFGDITLDSRLLKAGDCFVAIKGHRADGRQYIADAIDRGVVCIICEANNLDENILHSIEKASIPFISITNLNAQLSLVADIVFGSPSSKTRVIGVTGTNGKSSCVQMLAQALHHTDGCCWSLGTLGCGPLGALKINENTTADAITVQREIAKAVQYDCANVAAEVSSHGLVQGRVSHIAFNVAVFTNLTHDHLDYHKTMDEYFNAKRKLFLYDSLECVVLNVDDKFGRKLKKDPQVTAPKLFISTNEPTAGSDLQQWIWTSDVRLSSKGIFATVYTPWGAGELHASLIGHFNLYNVLSVIGVLGFYLKDINQVLDLVKQLKSAPGRMQLVQTDNQPTVVIDYAHSPDALEQAIKAAREHCSGRITTVFGCGGDRDKEKRPKMAKIAEKYSNRLILTDDNPRTESPTSIIEDMKLGLKRPEKAPYVADRQQAIAEAIHAASANDLVLVAGKGHEDYQIYGTEKLPFSDLSCATDVLRGASI